MQGAAVEAGGKAGLKIFAVEIGGKAEKSKSSEQVSRVLFSIPLALTHHESEIKNDAIRRENEAEADRKIRAANQAYTDSNPYA